METSGIIGGNGRLGIRHIRAQRAGLGWKLRNLRHVLPGLLQFWAARQIGVVHAESRLYLRHLRADGRWVDYGLVSTKVLTTAFVTFLAAQMQTDSTEIGDFKYHDSGTGTGDEAVGDVGLGTAVTDNLRTAGTQVASTVTYTSVGTIAYTGAHDITEHGLFSNTRASGGTLADRSKFGVITVANLESIQFTYVLTWTAGG